MSMSKKDFIALADYIRDHNQTVKDGAKRKPFTADQLETLGDFFQSTNHAFLRLHWLGYIKGENGKNGESIKR